MTLILLVATLTLIGSFVCSLFEAALYATTPTQLELLRVSGRRGAEKFARLRGNIEEPIAAILTVNTITHTVGSAWCGAMVGDLYGSRSVGLFAALFTFSVLLLTEIIPKSVGVRHAASIAPLIAWPLQVMIWAVWPLVKGSGLLMRLLSPAKEGDSPTEEEVMALSRMAERGGQLRFEEQRWVENALRLDFVKARDLLTPRTVVQTLPAGTKLAELEDLGPHWVHSRVPVTEGDNLDRVIGVVYRRDVFDAVIAGERDKTLAELMQPIDLVAEATPGHELLDHFIQGHRHMVAVIDEFGGFEGVVTLEDVLECLLGEEIVDEHDRVSDLRGLALRQARRTTDPG
jgi:CBS domain containing-hemolysin-like protein